MAEARNTVAVHGGRNIYPRRFTWTNTGNGWRIGAGVSNFLIAEGSGYSRAIGYSLYKSLMKAAPRRADRAQGEAPAMTSKEREGLE